MNILNLPGWEVTGHTQTKTDYRIEAVYTPEPTAHAAIVAGRRALSFDLRQSQGELARRRLGQAAQRPASP